MTKRHPLLPYFFVMALAALVVSTLFIYYIMPLTSSATEQDTGIRYEPLAVEWTKWAYEAPLTENPVKDKTGDIVQVSQPLNDTFMLTGGYYSTEVRNITISKDIPIFFPVLVYVYLSKDLPLLMQQWQLGQEAAKSIDAATEVKAELDDKVLKPLRVQTPAFEMNLPYPNLLYINQSGIVNTVTDGYWIYLKPLEVGNHTIHFKGATPSYSTEATYNIQVK